MSNATIQAGGHERLDDLDALCNGLLARRHNASASDPDGTASLCGERADRQSEFGAMPQAAAAFP